MLSTVAIYKQNHVCPLSQQRKDPNRYFVLGSAICKEALQKAEKRRETKGKGEKERYTHLNAEFQKNSKERKVFLSEQCKEIEENNGMGKTRALIKKIRDTKGRFMQRWAQ